MLHKSIFKMKVNRSTFEGNNATTKTGIAKLNVGHIRLAKKLSSSALPPFVLIISQLP